MNSEKLMDAIGMIDRQYVAKYENVQKIRNKANFVKWGVAAACLCLLVGALSAAAFMKSKPKAPDVPPAETTTKTLPYAVVPKTIPPVPEDDPGYLESPARLGFLPYIISVDQEAAKCESGGVLTNVFYLDNPYFESVLYCNIEAPDGVELLTPREFIFDPKISPFFEISFRLVDPEKNGEIKLITKNDSIKAYSKDRNGNLILMADGAVVDKTIYFEREDGYDYSSAIIWLLPSRKELAQEYAERFQGIIWNSR